VGRGKEVKTKEKTKLGDRVTTKISSEFRPILPRGGKVKVVFWDLKPSGHRAVVLPPSYWEEVTRLCAMKGLDPKEVISSFLYELKERLRG